MKKNDIAKGLNGLLTIPQAETVPQETKVKTPKATAPVEEQEKEKNKPACYMIPPSIAKKIADIAYWDRKTISAVVTEAFGEYIERWDKAQAKK